MSLIQESIEEEKPNLISICNQGEFFVEPKEIKKGIALEEVSPITEIPKEVNKSLDECKEVGHDELFEVSPTVEDIPHHGTSIIYGFEDPFIWKESARDESFNFFKLVSFIISTSMQCVLQGMPNFISNRILKDFLCGSKLMNYGSMVNVNSWMMEEHQPIGIDYQPIRDIITLKI